jgi:hypothetical protein
MASDESRAVNPPLSFPRLRKNALLVNSSRERASSRSVAFGVRMGLEQDSVQSRLGRGDSPQTLA